METSGIIICPVHSMNTTDSPTVSVIIPNYNYARYLPDRIESVLNQTFRDFEVIILDDCSTDDSRNVIERYRDHPKVSHIIFNERNSGSPFTQWEKGLGIARGKYAWIAEADDLADPRFLEKTVSVIESDDDIAVVRAMSHLIDSDGNPSPRKPFDDYAADKNIYVYEGKDFLHTRMSHWNHVYNASMVLFRVDVWKNLSDKSYVNFRYVGDWLFWGQLMDGHKVAIIREHLSYFRLHGHSVTDGAKLTTRARAEGEIVKHLFGCKNPDMPYGLNIYNRYHLYRIFHGDPNSEVGQEIERFYPGFWKEIGITRFTYPYFWLYKHSIWLIEKRMLRSNGLKLKPLSVIKGQD